jgi:hypothetical protein
MAAETRTPTKNPKTQIIRMMLNHSQQKQQKQGVQCGAVCNH